MKRNRIMSYILILMMIITCFSPMQADSVIAKTSKSKINKTQVTMYPGETVNLSVSGAKKVSWKSSNTKIATVSKKGVVKAKKSGKAKITARVGKKTYSCKVTVKKKPAVTRGEWISALLKQVGIKTASVSSYHFADTKQYSAGKIIETAYNRNIIPTNKSTKNFYPNRPAMREFVAVTAVRAMGFKADKSSKPKCSDKGKLKYAAEDKIAINQKFITLKKGKFLPASAITKAEEKKTLAAIMNIKKVEQVNKNHKDVIKYQAGVVQQSLKVENNFDMDASGKNMTITIKKDEDTPKIQKGQVIILPQKAKSQEQIAFKVTDISDDGNGMIRLIGITPEISEVYKIIDVQRIADTDMSDFKINSDVVESFDASSSAKQKSKLQKTAQAEISTTVGESVTLQLKETKIGKAGSVKGSVELSAPEISAIVDADFSNELKPKYNQVTVSLKEDVTAKATLKFSSKGSGAEKIYLGHVTGSIGYGLYVDVLCYLNISADGEATVQYTVSNTVGISYINDDFRMDSNVDSSWEGTKAEITGQVLGEPQINLRVMGCWFGDELYGEIPVIGVQAGFGPKFKSTVKVHDTTPKTCANVSIYAYLSVGLNTDSGLGEYLKKHTKLSLSKTIWDDNSSNPFRAVWHYEDGVRTEGDVCTYKKDESNKTPTTSSFQLSNEQYEKVKGEWEQNSSGGWNVEFTKTEVKYFDRNSGDIEWTAEIKNCKKEGNVYIYYIQSEGGKFEYRTIDGDPDTLEYFYSWDDANIADYYSGSSSLSRIEDDNDLQNIKTNEEIVQLLLDYYNNISSEDGTYVVFDNEIEDRGSELLVLVRYQWSDEEIEKYEEVGAFPGANILVCGVMINKLTGEAEDDYGHTWKLW